MAADLPPNVDEASRRRMIEEAAYYLAQRRGFSGGDPQADWAEAERQVDEQLAEQARRREAEVDIYRRLRDEVRRLLGEARGTIGPDTIRETIDRASRNFKDVGEQGMETVQRAAAAVQRDLAAAADRLGPTWDTLSDKTADLFAVWRRRGAKFLDAAGSAVADWVAEVRGRSDQVYRAGDLAPGGTFACCSCDTHIDLKEPGHLPPCPNCHGDEFRQV